MCGSGKADKGLEKGISLHSLLSSCSNHLLKQNEQWCQGKNSKSNPKVLCDSSVFYKSIYISLFGHGKVYWHKEHKHKGIFRF